MDAAIAVHVAGLVGEHPHDRVVLSVFPAGPQPDRDIQRTFEFLGSGNY